MRPLAREDKWTASGRPRFQICESLCTLHALTGLPFRGTVPVSCFPALVSARLVASQTQGILLGAVLEVLSAPLQVCLTPFHAGLVARVLVRRHHLPDDHQ